MKKNALSVIFFGTAILVFSLHMAEWGENSQRVVLLTGLIRFTAMVQDMALLNVFYSRHALANV